MDGMYYALLEGRFLFDFVHEEKLAPEELKKYSALLLPNIALLSDEQCRQLRAYVDGGGSLLATFETSLYTERNERRAGFRPGGCVRHPQGGRNRRAPSGNAYYGAHREAAPDSQRLRQHPLDPRRGIPRARRAGGRPGPDGGARFRGVPAGACRIRRSRGPTNRPWWCAKRARAGWSYFPGDIERTMWRPATPIWRGCCRTPSAGSRARIAPVTIEGEGVMETFAWETRGRASPCTS